MKSDRTSAKLKNVYRTPLEKTDRIAFIRLDKNECSLQLPQRILTEIQQSVTPEYLGCYPEVYKLYRELESFHNLPEESILVAAGSDGAIRAAFDAFVSPGDEVINIHPNFAMYEVYSHLREAIQINIGYNPQSLALDVSEVIARINRRTAVLVLSNPNSPTGVEIPQEDLEIILNAAERYETRVIVDEAYYPFSDRTSVRFLGSYDNLIVLRTFSKAFGLAGLRVGYALSSKENIELMGKSKPMYEINTLGVLCACTYVKNYELVRESVKEYLTVKEWFVESTESLGLSVISGSANFVNIVVGRDHVQELVGRFREKSILIRPGYPWGVLEDCIRISIGNKDDMRCAFDVLKRWKNDG